MNHNLNLLLDVAMGLNLVSLACSRLQTLIRVMALQGVILGLMPLVMEHDLDWRVALIALATVFGKGMVIPLLLRRALALRHATIVLRIAHISRIGPNWVAKREDMVS